MRRCISTVVLFMLLLIPASLQSFTFDAASFTIIYNEPTVNAPHCVDINHNNQVDCEAVSSQWITNKPIDDLAFTTICYSVGAGDICTDYSATSPNGGGQITHTVNLPLNVMFDITLTITGFASDGTNVGASVGISVRVDRLPPGKLQ